MLGYSLMGLWLFTIVYMQILKHTIVQSFMFSQIEITDSNRWLAGIFAGALFTLVLSHIFLKGI